MPLDTVVWINQNWPTTLIEIRKGNEATASNNPVVASPRLTQGQEFSLTSDGIDFYWTRREPASGGVYIHRPCYGLGQTFQEIV